MKKLISMVMVVLMCLTSFSVISVNAESERLESGNVVYGSPGYKNPENYTANIAHDGDMILDLETDGGVYIQVIDENDRYIAPKEYIEKTEYGTHAGKDSFGYYLSYSNSNTTKEAKADFIYSVKSGKYSIILKAMYGQLCHVKITPKFPEDIAVMLNNKKINFDQPPIIVNERTLVPVRAIFEALGATVEWDSETNTVVSKKGNTTISLTIGDNIMKKNDKSVTLDVAPQIINERTLVPARAIAEAFGCNVDWDDDTQTVLITN